MFVLGFLHKLLVASNARIQTHCLACLHVPVSHDVVVCMQCARGGAMWRRPPGSVSVASPSRAAFTPSRTRNVEVSLGYINICVHGILAIKERQNIKSPSPNETKHLHINTYAKVRWRICV